MTTCTLLQIAPIFTGPQASDLKPLCYQRDWHGWWHVSPVLVDTTDAGGGVSSVCEFLRRKCTFEHVALQNDVDHGSACTTLVFSVHSPLQTFARLRVIRTSNTQHNLVRSKDIEVL